MSNTGRIPAQCTQIPAKVESTLSSPHTINTNGDIMHQNAYCQQLPWPNYCEHLPDQPTFFTIPPTHKPRALAIQECIKKLTDAYFKPKKILSSLQNYFEKKKQVKSQRREAAIKLLQAMLYYVCDATGKVGRLLPDGTFKSLTLEKLSEYAGIRLKRAKRAMKAIVKAGYLKVTHQYTRSENGEYIGLPSVREFLPKFFTELDIKGDLWVKWFSNREYKKNQIAKKESKRDKIKARATISYMKESIKGMMQKTSDGYKRISGAVKKIVAPEASNPEHTRKLMQDALYLHKQNPSRSCSDYYTELKLKYPPPT